MSPSKPTRVFRVWPDGTVEELRSAIEHSQRFRKVSTRYPRRVTEAYDGDTEQAAHDSDERVAARVAAWERAQGLEPRDWQAIDTEERDETEDAVPV